MTRTVGHDGESQDQGHDEAHEGGHEEEAGRHPRTGPVAPIAAIERPGRTGPILPVRMIEAAPRVGWNADKGISRYISQLVRGTLKGAVKMSPIGWVGGAAKGIYENAKSGFESLQKIGEDMKLRLNERAHIGKIGPLVSAISRGTALAVANVLTMPVAAVAGSVDMAASGGQNVADAVIGKYDKRKGAAAAAPTAESVPSTGAGH